MHPSLRLVTISLWLQLLPLLMHGQVDAKSECCNGKGKVVVEQLGVQNVCKVYYENAPERLQKKFHFVDPCTWSGTYIHYYENGSTADSGQFISSRRHGDRYMFKADGSLYHLMQYESGTQHGLDISFTESGIFFSQFHMGERNSISGLNIELGEVGVMMDDVRHGLWVERFRTGRIGVGYYCGKYYKSLYDRDRNEIFIIDEAGNVVHDLDLSIRDPLIMNIGETYQVKCGNWHVYDESMRIVETIVY